MRPSAGRRKITKALSTEAQAKSWAFVSLPKIKRGSEPPRQNWDKIFRAAGSAVHDELLLGSVKRNAFDGREWKW